MSQRDSVAEARQQFTELLRRVERERSLAAGQAEARPGQPAVPRHQRRRVRHLQPRLARVLVRGNQARRFTTPPDPRDWWGRAQEIDPSYPRLHQSVLSKSFCRTDAHAETISSLEQTRVQRSDDPLILAELAYCYAVSGDREAARDIL